MKVRMGDLRKIIRESSDELEEDLKNVGSKHEKTVAGGHALKMMHDAPGVMEALAGISSPKELAQVIEAIIDAVPIVGRAEVMRALNTVGRHERTNRKR